MKQKYFSAVVVNTIIVLTLAVLAGAALGGGATTTVNGVQNNAVYNGNRNGNKVTLMINVYWETEYVLAMAEIFEKYGFKTTFFVGGCWADDNMDIIKELSGKGFEIANHGYFHKNHKQLSYQSNYDEIIMTEKLIAELTGADTNKLFAPPSGYLGANMFSVCKNEGFKVIMWTRDTIDWRYKDSGLVYKRAVADVCGGDLVLMHPTEHTLTALPKILDTIKEKGLVCDTVSQNLKAEV